jgi:hypothetical protein
MTQSEGINLLIKAFTHSNEISDLDLDLETPKSIYFTWRSVRYKLDIEYTQVEEVDGKLLKATDTAELFTRLLKLIYSHT